MTALAEVLVEVHRAASAAVHKAASVVVHRVVPAEASVVVPSVTLVRPACASCCWTDNGIKALSARIERLP